MRIRAKFLCNNVDTQPWGENVELSAVTADTPENKEWSEATPSGNLTMNISNPGAQGQFQRGEVYFIDITPAKDEEAPAPAK